MEKTIHFKAIADVKEFVNIVSQCSYDIDLISDKYVIDAKSLMGIFSLDLSNPIKVKLHNDDCTDILNKLEKFIVNE